MTLTGAHVTEAAGSQVDVVELSQLVNLAVQGTGQNKVTLPWLHHLSSTLVTK